MNKFKKLVKECCYHATIKPNFNRGISSGPINKNLIYKYRPELKGKLIKTSKVRTYYYTKSGKISKTHISNPAFSGIIGWFDSINRRENRRLRNNYYLNLVSKSIAQGIAYYIKTQKFVK